MRTTCIFVLCSLFFLGIANNGQAALRLELHGETGYNTYAFPDLNETIDRKADAGWEIDNLDGGLSFGGGMRVFLSDHLVYGLYYRNLAVSSEGTPATAGNLVADKKDLSAHNLESLFLYNIYQSTMFRLNAGIGLDIYLNTIENTTEYLDSTKTSSNNVNGYGARPTIEAQFILSSRFNLTLDAGYRYATSSDDYFNWSGMSFNVGLSYCLTECNYPDGLAGASFWYGGGSKPIKEKELKRRYLGVGSIKVGDADATDVLDANPIFYPRVGVLDYDEYFRQVAVVKGAVAVLEEVIRLKDTGDQLDFEDRGELMSLILRADASSRALQPKADELEDKLDMHFGEKDPGKIPQLRERLNAAKEQLKQAEQRIPQLEEQLSTP